MTDQSPTTIPPETRELIETVLFHFWNCDGKCGYLHHSIALLSAHVGYESYPGQAEEIASNVGRDVWCEALYRRRERLAKEAMNDHSNTTDPRRWVIEEVNRLREENQRLRAAGADHE